MKVIDYVREEVYRQGHDIDSIDGIERVGWMLNAWSYALTVSQSRSPEIDDAIRLGQLMEPNKNYAGLRTVRVRVGSRLCPDPLEVQAMLCDLFTRRDSMTPLEFYKAFEEVHPFIDGNGRTGKVIMNWLGHTLLRPAFPPNDFWGRPIRNP